MFENYISKMAVIFLKGKWVNSCPGQNGRYYADDIFMCIFVKGNFCILIKDSLKFVPNGLIENNPASWWRHQMETFSALLAICAGNSPVPGEFPTQRPVTRSFDVYFDLRPNKRLSKQS